MNTRLRRPATIIGWSFLALMACAYGAYALGAAWAELTRLAGSATSSVRSAPIPFVAHAVAGALALLGGLTQFLSSWRVRWPRLHRMIGWSYAVGVCVSGTAALRLSVTFAVPVPARLSFAAVAFLWLGVTISAVAHAANSVVSAHRDGMLRSYALTLFFVTGSVWMEAATWVPISYEIAYPLAVTFGWAFNLLIAEAWIRRRR